MKKLLFVCTLLIFCLSAKAQHGKTIKFKEPTSSSLTLKPHTNSTIQYPQEVRESRTYESVDFATYEKSERSSARNLRTYDDFVWYRVPAAKSVGWKNLTTDTHKNKVLNSCIKALNIGSPIEDFSFVKESVDELGITHTHLQQTADGIPIYGAEIIVHTGENEHMVNGKIYDLEAIDLPNQNLSRDDVINIIRTDCGSEEKTLNPILYPNTDNIQSSTLTYFINKDKLATLVWHIEYVPNAMERWDYMINAVDGSIYRKFSKICNLYYCHKSHNHSHDEGETCVKNHEKTSAVSDGPVTATAQDLLGVNRTINTYEVGSTFFMIDGSQPMFNNGQSNMPSSPVGAILTLNGNNGNPQQSNFSYDYVTSSNNNWNNPTAVSAHYNAEVAYNYFRTTYNRNSINGQGGNVISLINITDENGQSMDNAFWNGAAMFYGNGNQAFDAPLSKALDIAGHEMSHGVVQAEANLEYQNESGALNESFADIFGAMMDRNDWKMGEDVMNNSIFPSGALRDLQNPHNGGNSLNDPGYQPEHTNEQYFGNQDNGGVHINSGIVNKAYYLFATAVGKDVAEKIYYRALANHLTRTSNFLDCRFAVIKAATDLHGANSSQVSEVKSAFTAVGIGDDDPNGNGTDPTPDDIALNPGQEFIALTDIDQENMWIGDFNTGMASVVSTTNPQSNPSITDNGSEMVYVSEEGHIILLDLAADPIEESVLSTNPEWRNCAISKDGKLIAALTSNATNQIFIFVKATGQGQAFDLYNPTSADGVSTGDALYADVLEFDYSGENLMYDAFNEINGAGGTTISYWDIGFMRIWDNNANSFGDGFVSKLFNSLPDNSSVGNPSFSKNSPYIVALDFIAADGAVDILGVDIEQNEVGLIYENEVLGYPNYNVDDDVVVFDAEAGLFGDPVLATIEMESDKINGIESTAESLIDDFRWGVYFATGDRSLDTGIDEILSNVDLIIKPNPTDQLLNIQVDWPTNERVELRITDIVGKNMLSKIDFLATGMNNISLDIEQLGSGNYLIHIVSERGIAIEKFIKL